jgi:hypothetical protein
MVSTSSTNDPRRPPLVEPVETMAPLVEPVETMSTRELSRW